MTTLKQQTRRGPYLTHLLIFTAIPTLLALIYLTLLAQPIYETETKLIVRQNQTASSAAIPGFASALLGMGSKTSLEDALILEEYLHSATFIEIAARKLDLRSHFQKAPSDPFRRLSAEAASEDFHKFFRKMISVRIALDSSILSVSVRAFSPTVAWELADFIIERSEEMINDLNERMIRSQTSLVQRELNKSMDRLMEVREALLQFQIDNSMVDPVGETSAYFSNIAALDSRLVEKRTEMRTEAQYLQDDAFTIRRLRQEIQALEEQRKEETRLLVSEADGSMVATLQAYEKQKMQKEFALAAYTAAFALAEKTTMDASQQEKFLLVIAPPHKPQKPAFPKPVRGTATVFVLLCIGFGIFRLILATVRDHTI